MEYIYIGKIVNTHGIKGELRILSKFPYKDKVFKKGMPLYINKETKEIINTYRKHKNFDMVTFYGYSDINEVLKYKGKNVYANAEDIKLDVGKYLDEELVGLDIIFDESVIGTVFNIERYEKTSLIVVKNKDRSFLLPYSEDLIEKIDIEGRKIYMRGISGLF